MGSKRINWEEVASHYRLGLRSLRDIGAEYGVSEGGIRKRAKKEGWPRDLSEKIKAKADDLVRIDAVRSGTQNENECELVAANAKIQSDIILAHRVGIPNKRDLVAKLFKEIEGLTDNTDIVEQMVLALGSGDMDKLAKVAQKVSTLPSRIKGVADLVTAYKTLVGMERQAFGIDNGQEEKSFTLTLSNTDANL